MLINLGTIRTMAEAVAGQISHIFLHWSAGKYESDFPDYHISIHGDGTVHASTDDLTEYKPHTWQRNTGAIGVSLACAFEATPKDLGEYPPTNEQVEALAQVVAVLCMGLGLSCNRLTVMTHAEVADIDGYGPATTYEKWDLSILHTGDEPMSGGDTLRGKANYYIANGVAA